MKIQRRCGLSAAAIYLGLSFCLSMPGSHAETTSIAQQLNQLATQGIPLTVNSNVTDSASVEAVLIPPHIAKRVFGGETGKNYLVIELLVSNHNPDASLVIQSLFLDYTEWLPAQADDTGNCLQGRPALADLGPSQRTNCPKQIASAEYRLVRAELQDKQPFTTRNLIVNGATALGSIGTAFTFPFTTDVVKGINAWNGGVVPALSSLYPDPTINQLNHISDLGFQTNKVIPKQSSDVVVAFFPIDRILTSSLKKMYFEDPAVFFVPGELELEHKYSKQISKLIRVSFPGFKPEQYMQLHSACGAVAEMHRPNPGAPPADAATLQELTQSCAVSKFLNDIALTRIHIGIGGDMTVSTQVIPPTITAVTFKEPLNAGFWTKNLPAKHEGAILGTYLLDGIPAIVDKQGEAMDGLTIAAANAGGTSTNLPFTMTVAKCIASGSEIYMKVTKHASTSRSFGSEKTGTAAGGSQTATEVSSMLFDYGPLVHAEACPASDEKKDKPQDDKKQDKQEDKKDR